MLEWQKNAPKKPMNHYEAKKFANSLGEGWRLATKEELEKAFQEKVGGFRASIYWSSSTFVNFTSVAWGVSFINGYKYNFNKTLNYYVRCVRELT